MAVRSQRPLLSSASLLFIYGVAFSLFCLPCNGEGASEAAAGEEGSTRPPLTGIPQIDYIWDPNLPRELNGYNMSSYPFLPSVPEKIDFKCDGLHDGFYASIPHKCQVYHHCLFGTRYDFLCANYTAFDQKNFICHFASEVDCANSAKFFDRNEALYKAQSTEAPTTAAPARFERPRDSALPDGPRRWPLRKQGRRRRPIRPVYYDDYYDYDYSEYDAPGGEDEEQQPIDETEEGARPAPAPAKAAAAPAKSGGKGNLKIFDGPRAPPRIRPPVPNSAKKPAKATTTTAAPVPEEAADELAEDNENDKSLIEETEPEPTTKRPAPKKQIAQRPKAAAKTTTTTTTTTPAPVEEEITQKPPRKASTGLLNPAARRPNVLVNKRTKALTTTTAAPEEFEEEEEEQIEEISEEPLPAATRTPSPVTRRPLRPAPEEDVAQEQQAPIRRPGARRGPQAAPQPVEEEVEQPAPQLVRKRPTSRTGPQSVPVEEPEEAAAQPATRRRPSSRQGPQSAPVPVESAEAASDEPQAKPVRRGQGFRRGPQGEQIRQQRQDPLEAAVEDHEETVEESQVDLSVLNLFSNAGPRVS